MARRDGQLLAHLGAQAGLDEGDVAYLLGEDPSSDAVSDAMSAIRKVLSGEEEQRDPDGADAVSKKATRLSDF